MIFTLIRENSTVIRLLALPVIIVFAFLAHLAFVNKDSTLGAIFITAAAGSLMAASRPNPLACSAESKPTQPQLASGWRRTWGLSLVVTSGVMFWLSFDLFWALEPGETPDRLPWEYFTTGMITFMSGFLILTHGTRWRWKIHPWHAILLLMIVIYAIYTRTYDLGDYPFGVWYDEATNGLEARAIQHNPDHRPVLFNHMTSHFLLWLYKTGLSLYGATNITGVRIVEALFGVGAVIMSYAVGSELRGPRFGLLMAFFMAIMRWSINFSRIGMPGIETTFFLLLSFYFLYRFFQHQRWRDAFLFGIAAGFGLWFYAAFRFAGLALIFYALLKSRFWRRPHIILVGLMMIIVLLITIFPLAIYAHKNTDAFTLRSRQVLIIYPEVRRAPTFLEALQNNTEAHLLMFHVEGDRNGRHNLPKEPMLDPIMGTLMMLGIGLALRGWRRSEECFFVLLLIAGLTGGILTLDWEAPQALRSIGVLPAIAYFCALATRAIITLLQETHRSRILLPLVAIALAFSTWTNHQIYFDQQRHNYQVWKSYSANETVIGNIAAKRSDDTLFYNSPLVGFSLSGEFLAPNLRQRQQALSLTDALPLRVPPTDPITIFLHQDDGWLFEYGKRLYPNARFHTITPADYGIESDNIKALFYIIDLSTDDIANIQGLAENGTGILYAPFFGDYIFDMPDETIVYLDGQPLPVLEEVRLRAGNHPVRIEPADAIIEWLHPYSYGFQAIPEHFFYHDPVRLQGFTGFFYLNEDWQGEPSLKRLDLALDVYFHHLPAPRPYTATWKGWLEIDTPGEYGFQLLAVEWAELLLDGHTILSVPARGTAVTTQETLLQRDYLIEIRFLDNTSHSEIRLRWRSPGAEEFTTIPPEQVTPYLTPR